LDALPDENPTCSDPHRGSREIVYGLSAVVAVLAAVAWYFLLRTEFHTSVVLSLVLCVLALINLFADMTV